MERARARDRDADGRPEQRRPRDRTGRPLDYGTSGVATTEAHDPQTVADAAARGVELWNEHRFFEAHECLELVWHGVDRQDAPVWQGVIQIAVAAVHLQRGNPSGARRLFARAAAKLDPARAELHGVDLAAARKTCARAISAIDRGADPLPLPRCPVGPAGVRLPDAIASLHPESARAAQRPR